MKSLQELAEIREKMKSKVAVREGHNDVRVVVGMATCGIAAGARPVLNTLVEEVEKQGLSEKATVSQTGCIGICRFEPVVEIYDESGSKTTYVHVTPEKIPLIFAQHVVNGSPVAEYTIGASAK